MYGNDGIIIYWYDDAIKQFKSNRVLFVFFCWLVFASLCFLIINQAQLNTQEGGVSHPLF